MKKAKVDKPLLIVTIVLVLIGIMMVYSASNVVAAYKYNDQFYYFKRQAIFAFVSIILMLFLMYIKIDFLYKRAFLIFMISVIFLLLVLIPGIGLERGGARSWIGIGSLSFQPSEFAKMAIIILLARIFSSEDKKMHRFKNFIIILIIILSVFGLIMLQPDFGTGIVIVLASVLLLFVSGAKIRYFIFLLILGIAGIAVLIISAPYRLQRITAFLDPWSDPLGSGFQAIQSIYALAPSGLFGLGFNNSIQKHFFLPEPQNDFIFAIVAEEFGLIGGIILLGLFLIMILRIIKISQGCSNKFYMYLSLGIGLSLFVQIFINIGVVIGLMPITGITLPIISCGGTSLMMTLIQIAFVLNISRFGDD